MSDTKRDFSTISIYIDENENMIGIPCGESDKYGIADIDKVKTNDTYSLMPTFNDFERGPLVIDDDERIILANYQKGELAEIMKDFIQIYVKANMFYKEKQELEEEKKRRENNWF